MVVVYYCPAAACWQLLAPIGVRARARAPSSWAVCATAAHARVKVVKNSIISTASLAGSARARDDSRHIYLTSSGPAQTSVRMEERA